MIAEFRYDCICPEVPMWAESEHSPTNFSLRLMTEMLPLCITVGSKLVFIANSLSFPSKMNPL